MTLPVRLPERLPSLTGLRFFGAIAVILFHALCLPPITVFQDEKVNGILAFLVSKIGFVSVTFFFILSGFVLTWSARDDDTPRKFWRRRFFRIFPNHAVMWAACLLLLGGAPVWVALLNLLLVQSWVPNLRVASSVNIVTWSLSCELFFYAIFPFLLRPIKRIARARLWFWTLGALVAVLVVPFLAVVLMPGEPKIPVINVSTYQYWFSYNFPIARLGEFLLGMLLARVVREGLWIRLPLWGALTILGVSYFGMLAVPLPYGVVAAEVIPCALLVAAAAMAEAQGTNRFFGSRLSLWLGNISYALFMSHAIVLYWGRPFFLGDQKFSTPVALGLVALAVALSILLAWVLYVTVERPIVRRWSTSTAVRPQPAPVVTSSAT
ncbi:acyltransferase family protein [Micromonospora eburnea]|uniref:Peptidoglycan/LPS O-acetylase OafA/YrhL, contains acyltransferase and SGNH-hydrolase domains n=1 Tax=Micromonospora eburnea TaxID=227316 RepID=A0A1C6UZC5_9ACTN|nr:acyltransferase [Micromonospora eburnea]SCL59307.1 Peptidoglycan/LPS O-acetylase OafA/YrhL, contains acyltransferase and SGNH-hydrolase domains [Micromonospora eburnea]